MTEQCRSSFHLSHAFAPIRSSGTKLSRSFKLGFLVAAGGCPERLFRKLSSEPKLVRSRLRYSVQTARRLEVGSAMWLRTSSREKCNYSYTSQIPSKTPSSLPQPAAPQIDDSIVPRPAGPVIVRQLARYSCSTPLFPGLEDLLPFTFRDYTLYTYWMADGELIARVL